MNQKNIENIYPMTPMQEGILFHTLNAPQTGIYVVQSGYQFNHQINLSAFKQAWQQVINQHSVLRTSFHWQQHKEPFQVVYKQVELPWSEYTLADEEELATWLEKDRQAGFNLNQPPLMRLSLIHLDNNTDQFIWSCHHLILDGWSTALVLKQILDSYQAIVRDEICSLKPTRPYGDYVAWLRQQDLSQAKAYWQRTLKGFTTPTPLVMGECPKGLASRRGDRELGKWGEESLKLSLETTTALKSLAKEHRLTVNTILQGAWALLLSRYSGEEDVVFGATSAGRPPNLVGSESMVGLFINTLPVRVQVAANESLIPWLQTLQSQQIEAQQYEYTPLIQVQQWSDVAKDSPLFASILVFENYPVDTAIAEFGIEMEIEETQSVESTSYPLTISAGLRDELSLEILYDRNFDAATVQGILRHLAHLLEQFITDPEANLVDLSILTTAEKQQILIDWNNTQVNYQDNLCIHQLFEQQVAKTPDAVAVIFEEEQLTYQELDRRAEELAGYLQNIGVKPEVIVGICLERSLETIIAILAILKAGGAYLPLDSAYPQQRLDYILEDAQISLILTQNHLQAKIKSCLTVTQNNIQIICLDSNLPSISTSLQSGRKPFGFDSLLMSVKPPTATVSPCAPTSDNLAYVIYTSGSTGKPKGVAIAHSSLVNFAQAAVQEYEITQSDRILQFASISFDASVEEIYPCLIAGGTLVLRSEEMGYSPSLLLEKSRDYGMTILDLPTAFWHLLTAELEQNPQLQLPESIRLVIIGGEVVNPDKVASWNRLVGTSCQLINTYGPTEATVVATSYKISHQIDNLATIPIGKPLPNLQTYILNKNLQPVAIGVPGELYIGGIGVARGYLNRPELTKEKFINVGAFHVVKANGEALAVGGFPDISKVPNPKGGSPLQNGKLYKTGDKARYLSNGNIEFLGRIDNQVKIRGFRVELAEIEAILSQHPTVTQVAVALKRDANNESKLIAYLVLKENTTEQVATFKNFLQQQLPEYAIPSAFIFLDRLPMTINGKCDRDNLPTPDLVATTTANYIAPRTANEQKMADIWQEVLGVQVGIYDNFFDLGGHSLLIVRLFARIRNVFKIDLPFQFLFDAPILINFVGKLESFQTQEETETQTLDLKQEAFLDCTISLQNSQFQYPKVINNIFLTGATGFLGAFLLAELLRQTEADIYCLVRADNLAEGKQKIEQSLVNYLLWQDDFIARIIPVLGDLSQPFLGLSDAKFQSLATAIDLIYHNGAWVHHAMPYSTLKAANVLGTKEILRLASTEKIKPVHFISTISVFSGVNNSGSQVISEIAKIDNFAAPEGGYVQSKWVADKLVNLARDRGLPVIIYRPGGISGDSTTGVFNPHDFLYRLLIGCIELGAIPQGDFLDSLMPVDYVSQAIVSISRQPESLGKAFHLVNRDRLDFNILTNLIRAFGYELQELNQDRWQAKLTAIAENQLEHPLYPLISLLSSDKDSGNAPPLQFDCQNTLQALAKTGISCPAMDEKLLRTYLYYLSKNGFLKPIRQPAI
ncbi:MAG: amino acid adenylation domain-containing protein [Pleurocapsa minor HA4230-MV1]|jgi:amino acid adenylation domain-containing protein/thioester reductase-like protein|nr:amino acid adenylation domain-containing protein [Pleurocapsa minor HA4230-MV1]